MVQPPAFITITSTALMLNLFRILQSLNVLLLYCLKPFTRVVMQFSFGCQKKEKTKQKKHNKKFKSGQFVLDYRVLILSRSIEILIY